RALVLALDELRVDRAADVGAGGRAPDAHDARVRVDLDLGGPDADLPEDRAFGVRAGADRRNLPAADQLAAGEAEVLSHQRQVVVGIDVARAGDALELLPYVCGRALDGQPGDRRRPRGSGRAVVGSEARVGAPDGDPIGVDSELLRGDLRKSGARPLAHLG